MEKKRVTITDVAREAQVSETTVSLAFKEGSRISEPTRKRILETASRMSYFPDSAARRLRFGSGKSIGLIVTDITNPWHATVVRSADQIVRSSGYQLIIAESNWDAATEVDVTRNMIESRVLGLIMCFSETTEESYLLIRRSGIPHVAIDTVPPFYKGPSVLSDHLYAGSEAARHLLFCGCSRPAFFTSDPGTRRFSTFTLLEKGFLSGLRKGGIDPQSVPIIEAGLSISQGQDAYARLRASGIEVDCIFCVNDLCAIGALEEAKSRGVSIGEELRVIGIDNLEFSALETVSLTSFADPRQEIMKAAANYLIESIEDEEPLDIHRKFRSRLIERKSTSRAAH